ncbi:MAG: response regulator transcription factor [Spirochaetales bacterium]|nr:response regulator transcription factor [Spirochaetales bacterium]
MNFDIPHITYQIGFLGKPENFQELSQFEDSTELLTISWSEKNLPESSVDALIIPADHLDELAEPIKNGKSWIPVIAWGPMDKLASSFQKGCSDYLKDPWSPEELLIRVKKNVTNKALSFSWGRISIFPNKATSPFGAVKLSAQEFTILTVLAQQQGDIVPRETLYRELWGKIQQQSRVVDMHISSLRKKIQILLPRDTKESPIKSAHGRGYFIPKIF